MPFFSLRRKHSSRPGPGKSIVACTHTSFHVPARQDEALQQQDVEREKLLH